MKTGEELRDEGIEKAKDHAEKADPGWGDHALRLLRAFRQNTFLTEELRLYAYQNGLPRPPDDRAWGSVIAKARKQKMITFLRYEKVRNPKAHCRPATVWRKLP